MTRGYLYLAFGEYYVHELNNLVLTMRKSGDTLPISVVCTKAEVPLLQQSNMYDQIIVFDFKHPLYDEPELTQFEILCLIPRLLLPCFLPYDETMITDTDMLCQHNPSGAWEIMSSLDQAVVMTGMNYSPDWHFGFNHEVSAHLGKNVPESHGGIFLIKKRHKDLTKFFDMSIYIYQNYDSYKLRRLFRGGRVDEPVFAIANALLDYEVLDFDKHPVITFNYTTDITVPSKLQTTPSNKELNDYIPFIHMFKPHQEPYYTILNRLLS
jgi:hypothetical protein